MASDPMTISETFNRLSAGDTSATRILERLRSRIDRLEPSLNALCHVDWEGAFAAAEESEQRWRSGRQLGSLDGIPLHIKDNIFVRDVPCTWGSRLYETFVPNQDDWSVTRLRQQGAVLFAKTNSPEFALAGITTNDLFGTTRNPYDQSRTPGGSSGGAVAATMAGFGFGGLATDAGGSIRRPSGYSGAVGLRTSPGAVRRTSGFPAIANDFQTIGPIASNIEDLSILFNAVRCTAKDVKLPRRQDVRIRVILDAGLQTIVSEIESATRHAAAVLKDQGYHTDEIIAPWNRAEVEYAFRVMSASGVAHLASFHDKDLWQEKVTRPMQRTAEFGNEQKAVDYVRALESFRIRAMAASEFDNRTIWLMPTSPCTAWSIDEDYPQFIAGQPAEPRDSSVYAPVVNAMAATGLALPAGTDSIGLPIGVQLVAGQGQEDLVLTVGEDLARQLGDFQAPPRILDLCRDLGPEG